jgi:serine/threonine protein kinase
MNTEPTRRLGKYELRERLGHGGMAEVWKAYDVQLQRFVAIKLLHPNLQADPTFVTRFQREAQVIASLRHPNIVQIHDFEVAQPSTSPTSSMPTTTAQPSDPDNPVAYMVMSYIEGPTLAEYIASTSAKGHIPSPGEIVNLFASISLAVDYAHSKGMIHRDIKPANILLDKHMTARNPMGEPILTDFGLAKLLGVSAGTLTASSLGTPLYTSPEQASGYAGNERSDIYSLGVILYEMVTGVTPFRGESPMAVLAQHRNTVPTSPVLLNPTIPPALTLVIMTALAKDPNARFARATALTTAIADALHVPLSERLSQGAASSPDLGHMPTYFTPSNAQVALSASPPSSLASASGSAALPAASQTSLSSPAPTAPGTVPTMPYAGNGPASTPGIVSTGQIGQRGQVAPQPTGASSRQSLLTPAAPPVPPEQGAPPTPLVPPTPPPARRRRSGLYAVIAGLLILVLLGSGLGAYFLLFHKSSPPAPIPGGQAFFLSSGQLNSGTAQGIADELQINLQHVPAPQAGMSYYAWLLADRHPHVEAQPLEPKPLFTLPLLLGKLTVSNGNATLFYPGTAQHDNLFSLASRMLITEESSNGTPLGPAANRSTWRYYAEIPQTPYGTGATKLSALDHIRHLFYKETVVNVLGLPGGLDIWLFRNTEKVMEWSISARDDYHTQISDPTVIHNLFLSILDYLDGAPNVHIDVPPGSPLVADPIASRVALLSVVPAQSGLTEVTTNPPGYTQHVALHLNGVVQAPDATQQMRQLATKIIEALNNVKTWLGQVRSYAQQLVMMNAAQLSLPSTQTMLDNMLLSATYAYIGQLDPQTNQVIDGVLQIHYDIANLATLTLTPNLPQTI